MSDDVLLVERDGPVTHLVLNRPDKLNAFNSDLVEALLAAFGQAAAEGARLVTLKGQGRGFSAGFDVSGLEAQSDGDLALRFLRLEQLLQAVHYAPFATLALLHGPCLGAAADLATSCTRRIATSNVKIRMPGLRFGVVLGTRRLAERIGADAARKVLETSATLTAPEALELRLLTCVSEVENWSDAIAEARAAATFLPASSQRALFAETSPDTRDAEMAALVRSVAEPGLRERIGRYVAGLSGPAG